MYRSGLVDMLVTHANMTGLGRTPLLGDHRGFMPPQLKTKQTNTNTDPCFQNKNSGCRLTGRERTTWSFWHHLSFPIVVLLACLHGGPFYDTLAHYSRVSLSPESSFIRSTFTCNNIGKLTEKSQCKVSPFLLLNCLGLRIYICEAAL